MSRIRLWALVIIGLSLAVQPAAAQTTLLYEFANAAGVPTTTFNVAPGQQIPIRVYLRESTAGAPLMTSQQGMGTVSVRVSFGTGAIAAVNAVTDIQPASGASAIAGRTLFDFPSSFLDPTPAAPTSARLSNGKFLANAGNPGPGVFPADFGETNRVLIGTFVFTGKSVGNVQLVAADPNPTATGDITNFATGSPPLDTAAILASGATANLIVAVPVPEPGTMALAGLGIAGLVAYRRRRAVKS
ncbi:MAG TPA: PEP-CTERM sorting domain-containing protein [Gemmataceae bacterium]|jgi:hypothetical protein|nr:PEP-CTERM sorting domain-containing protein [Gemmataceae bacterium]